jgi:D-alanyl-lipoteichoic acid acyltransferase DltB (MBOAT superfamily)
MWATASHQKDSPLTRQIAKEKLSKEDTGYDDIANISHPSFDYSLVSSLAYQLYPPLYIAGPIISFNAYYHYTKSRQQSESNVHSISSVDCLLDVLSYALRWCFAFVLLELATAYFPFFAIIKSSLAFDLFLA